MDVMEQLVMMVVNGHDIAAACLLKMPLNRSHSPISGVTYDAGHVPSSFLDKFHHLMVPSAAVWIATTKVGN